MSYKFAPQLILRKPVGKLTGYHLNLPAILNDPHFKAGLYIASPGFYASLDGLEPEDLTARQRLTIFKYYNRFCFRPTPFGLFSSVTLLDQVAVPSKANTSPLYRISTHLAQAYDLSIGLRYTNQHLRAAIEYEPNPTLYRVLKEYRFIMSSLDEDFKNREYLLQSVGYTKILERIIRFCRTGKLENAIIHFIAKEAECTLEEASAYFDFLTDGQFLLHKHRPNITGPAYTDFLKREYRNDLLTPGLSAALLQANGHPDLRNAPGCAHIFKNLSQRVSMVFPGGTRLNNPDHLNIQLGEAPGNESSPPCWQEQLRTGIYALSCLTREHALPAMTEFVQAYQKHFEGRQIPLLLALDPEAGLGYQQPLAQPLTPLLETLDIKPKEYKQDQLDWTPAHSFLLNSWHQCEASGQGKITLSEDGLATLQEPKPIQMLGQAVLFRQANENLYIESAGGTNAPALAGRFTASFEKVKEAAIAMARDQEALNPNVIFAEILHLSDAHVDNINRRAQIYTYELPLTASSALPLKQQLPLSDLYLQVTGNKVYLISAKLGKIVVPRLTSAYNHTINQLPIFRFLADLSYQYGSSGFSLDLRQYFPGLHYYPRVEYKKIILHLATWVLTEQQLRQLSNTLPADSISAFKDLQNELRLPPVFMLAQADQQLVFNTQHPEEIEFFLACIRPMKQAVLKEYCYEKAVDGGIRPAAEFSRQYNAFLLPTVPIPMPALPARYLQSQPKHRKFMPGSEWLYLKIYTSNAGANPLLIKLHPLLLMAYSHGQIKKWFFIRYEDHAPHIRLRLHIDPDDTGEILIAFKKALNRQVGEQVIREYQLNVYSRELERYRAGDYGLTEQQFAASSNFVLRALRKSSKLPDFYLLAMTSTRDLLNVFLPSAEEQLVFAHESFGLFIPEFGDPDLKLTLDRKYRELDRLINQAMRDADFYRKIKVFGAAKEFLRATVALESSVSSVPMEKRDFLRSIIHMHLNRIYNEQARKQEMITYYFLYKYLTSAKARSMAVHQL